MKRIALFGGSFDPVHFGHLEMARKAHECAALDSMVFLPCWRSPFKGQSTASGEERLRMLQLAIEEMKWSWAEASNFEVTKPGPSYSWETVKHYRKTRSDNVEWCWLLGTDQWEEIENWANPDYLRKHLTFLVATREGNEARPRKGWKHESMEFDHPASSTLIRSDFASHRHWLSESVAQYAAAIYGSDDEQGK